MTESLYRKFFFSVVINFQKNGMGSIDTFIFRKLSKLSCFSMSIYLGKQNSNTKIEQAVFPNKRFIFYVGQLQRGKQTEPYFREDRRLITEFDELHRLLLFSCHNDVVSSACIQSFIFSIILRLSKCERLTYHAICLSRSVLKHVGHA